MMQSGAVPLSLMPTLYPSLRLLGVPTLAAHAAQSVLAALSALAVAWAWRRRGPIGLKAGVLCLATLLAMPFAYAYDLVLLTLPLFWLAAAGIRTRAEVILAALAALLPFLGPGLAKLDIPIGPLVIGGLLVVTLRRVASQDSACSRNRRGTDHAA